LVSPFIAVLYEKSPNQTTTHYYDNYNNSRRYSNPQNTAQDLLSVMVIAMVNLLYVIYVSSF